jgi:hypothetical protein
MSRVKKSRIDLHKKFAAFLTALMAAVLLCTALPSAAMAAEAENTAKFTVQAQIPTNQIDKKKTYFDLGMSTEQVQTLIIKVTNTSNEKITIDLAAISASTNRNGVIDYCTPDIKDETMKYAFSEISRVNTPIIALDPYESKTASVEVKMPKGEYEGVVLGGLLFRRRPSEQESSGDEGSIMSITNVYSYVLAVKLTETDVEVKPDFELVKAESGQVNHYNEITYFVRNFEAAIAKNIKLNVKLFSHNSNKYIAENTVEGIDMAPNSVMPYGLRWPDGKVAPGKYTAYISLELDSKLWEFQQDFEISNSDAEDTNTGAIIPSPADTAGNAKCAWLVPSLIGLCALLLVVVIIILLILLKKRKKNEDETNTNTVTFGNDKRN